MLIFYTHFKTSGILNKPLTVLLFLVFLYGISVCVYLVFTHNKHRDNIFYDLFNFKKPDQPQTTLNPSSNNDDIDDVDDNAVDTVDAVDDNAVDTVDAVDDNAVDTVDAIDDNYDNDVDDNDNDVDDKDDIT